jgi:diacylglycerol kinase family enzyme
VKIDQDGESVKVKTLQIAVGNGRFYGGGMAVAADAAIDDHRLDLYSLDSFQAKVEGNWFKLETVTNSSSNDRYHQYQRSPRSL